MLEKNFSKARKYVDTLRIHKTPASLARFCGVRAQMRPAFLTSPTMMCIGNGFRQK